MVFGPMHRVSNCSYSERRVRCDCRCLKVFCPTKTFIAL